VRKKKETNEKSVSWKVFIFPLDLYVCLHLYKIKAVSILLAHAGSTGYGSSPVSGREGVRTPVGFISTFFSFFFCLGFSWALGPDLLSIPPCVAVCTLALFIFYLLVFICFIVFNVI
jgi:hypothetical protein